MSSELKKADITLSVLKRFQSKTVPRDDGCLIWQGQFRTLSTGRRYPLMSVGGRQRPAQQVAWRIANSIDHNLPARITQSCDNDLCVNPEHQVAAETNLKRYNLNKARS